MAQLKLLTGEDLELANRVYREIHFELSDADDRTFAQLEEGRPVALTRLQRHADGSIELGGVWVEPSRRGSGLARSVVAQVVALAERDQPVFCLSFAHLSAFYRSVGFADGRPEDAPRSIREKLVFCGEQLRRGRYEHPVDLLVRGAL
ncbi:MAG: GNAT family N-acetyltransferase [Planctomycetota bacterium]|nr:GNAT family N-acetyltransferase [Planctomycetota bacterium]